MPPVISRGLGRPFVAYVADPLAVGGVAPLLRQKRAVERLAAALGGHVARWGVDSGRHFAGQRIGDAALALLADLRHGDTLLVEDVRVLGADREAVEVVAGSMGMLGIAVLSARDLGFARVTRMVPEAAVPAWRPADRRPALARRKLAIDGLTLGFAS